MTQTQSNALDPMDMASQRIVESTTTFQAAVIRAATVDDALLVATRIGLLVRDLQIVQDRALRLADALNIDHSERRI